MKFCKITSAFSHGSLMLKIFLANVQIFSSLFFLPFKEFQEFMSLERDHEYYEQVDNDKEDIYDCPILNAQMQKAIKKKEKKDSGSGSKFHKPRRTKFVNHPTNQNG